MPSKKRQKPLYSRGKFELHQRPGRENYEIRWYESAVGRQRSRSTGSGDIQEAKQELDRLYLQKETGQSVCPTCRRPWEENRKFLLTQSMIDYVTARAGRTSIEAIKARLAHVHEFMKVTDRLSDACEDIDEDWIGSFREYNQEIPIIFPSGKTRDRAPATINNSVIQLAASINFSHGRRDTLYPAQFKALKAEEVNRTPVYRSDLSEIAEMFRYAMESPVKRANLLNFLRISVLTLVRPEHAHHISSDLDANQWHPKRAVMNLLPHGIAQTRKRRGIVPIARQAVPWLNFVNGVIVPTDSVKSAWSTMATHLGLPGDGQAGPKLIRRSMATLIRRRIQEYQITELELFLGHRPGSAVTDLYAPFEPGYLSGVLGAIESIIDDIEAIVPGAFHRADTADGSQIYFLSGGKSA